MRHHPAHWRCRAAAVAGIGVAFLRDGSGKVGVPFHLEHITAGFAQAGHEPQVPEALYEPLFARLYTRADVVRTRVRTQAGRDPVRTALPDRCFRTARCGRPLAAGRGHPPLPRR